MGRRRIKNHVAKNRDITDVEYIKLWRLDEEKREREAEKVGIKLIKLENIKALIIPFLLGLSYGLTTTSISMLYLIQVVT